VLDGVTDPHNLGALLRTAVAAGMTGAVLGRHRSAHVTPTVAKAAAGAVEHLPMALVAGIPAALADMARAGVWSVGLATDGDRSIDDLDLGDQALALVLGSEGKGLSRLVRQRCDVLAAIALRGPVESLNVAAAGAVAAFTFARARGL
jgi:23S rRNA (guanosine2251-2'-O)-methyltransferase